VCIPGSIHAQETTSDTTMAHSTTQDTVKQRTSAGVDTVVVYSAKDSILYSLRTRFMNLYGKSQMDYQTIQLKAEQISINWDNALLLAHGIQDTAK